MIDVHMIVYDEPQWQIDRCLESLKDEPITLHVIPGVEERRYKVCGPVIGRREGFSRGSAPFVSFVDPDDWIEPGAFGFLLDEIERSGLNVAYGGEYIHRDGRRVGVSYSLHHSYVCRRAAFALDDLVKEWRPFVRERTAPINKVLYNWSV
jgi:glycosyltransferase involved in cell wall biosynthesis